MIWLFINLSVDQLSVAESNHLLALETQTNNNIKPILVEILAKLAIRIEANKILQLERGNNQIGKSKDRDQIKIGDSNQSYSISFPYLCRNCGKRGHKASECR